MEMLEKAARALCEARLRKAGHCKSEEVLREKVGEYWPGHIGDARAVLQAIREPSEAMVAAVDYDVTSKALGATYPDSEGSFEVGGERIVWQAMLDAALAEGER